MVGRMCTHVLPDGRLCRATPLREGLYCFWHDPESEEEAAEARRLGGMRRRREKALSGAFDFAGLGSLEAIRRVLEVATIDALALDNGIARCRVLISAATAAAKLLEVGELEARIAALEAAGGLASAGDVVDLRHAGFLYAEGLA